MALEVYWYDFICFGIVGVSLCGALWVIWSKEGSSSLKDTTDYESLLQEAPLEPDSGVSVTNAVARGHISSSQLWSSCWRGVHPKWLLATRFLSFLIMSGFLAWDVVKWDAIIFTYYTEWTFALVIVYFALGTIVSAYGCWLSSNKSPPENGARTEFLRRDFEEVKGTIRLQSHHAQEAIQERAGFWGYFMLIAFQTSAGAVILTDVVFWCIIVPFISNSHLGLNLLMGCMHTLNAAFLLLDTALNSLPFPWFRLAYFVIWSCAYVIFQWVIHACGSSWWPYPFLELNTPWAPLWYFCLALVHIPCQGFGYWLQWQVPICALSFIIPALVALKFIKKGNAEPLKLAPLWRSCWRHINPLWLLFYRAYACLSSASVMYFMVASQGALGFYFYTQWTMMLDMLYFAVGTVISAYGCWVSSSFYVNREKRKTKVLNYQSHKDIHAGFWGYLMQAMYQISSAASLLTDIIFWDQVISIVLSDLVLACALQVNGFLHSWNAIFLLVDTALNGMSFTSFGFAYFVLWGCLYISVIWIIQLCGILTWWPYSVLKLDTPRAPLWYFGLALFHIPCYWIYALIVGSKNSFLPRKFPRVFVRWQVPVCALVFIIPAVVALKFIMKEKTEPLKFSHLWRSCWRDLNPLWLLFYRAFACLCLAWILYNIVALHGAFAFFFYTQWTLALVMFYFAVGTVISAYGCWVSSSSNTNRKKEFEGKTKVQSHHSQREIYAGSLGYLMQAMYQTSAGASILTDIVFWCVLVPLLANVQFEVTLLIGSLHIFNALLLIVDTALNGLGNHGFL
ncbi:hypothetical protein FNV43_RR23682 [Rhamnella rubrinervis]|uniref:Uncharacterized protein n=1 Tax=Rhamnella rubrinervis TaxID=2594499 RepID=A0A8K0DZE5_9ROSA|nr:hypothetical protein FNV43_RR23682 [Rhamnella rubrinervis]